VLRVFRLPRERFYESIVNEFARPTPIRMADQGGEYVSFQQPRAARAAILTLTRECVRPKRLLRADLARVHDALRIERALDGAHHVERRNAMLGREVL
jgi:hypothetical protein